MVRKEIKIATVYKRDYFDRLEPYGMNLVRWARVSEGLAGLGYQVDVVVKGSGGVHEAWPNLRYVPYSKVNWDEYDVIKTLFHAGFESIVEEGADKHPFIISKLGSVVGEKDDTEGVHFFGPEREKLYRIQRQIHECSRYITILTEPSKLLWQKVFGQKNVLMVPTGVDRRIPDPSANPYAGFEEKIAVYIGNIYTSTQKDVNLLWQGRLNTLGRLLKKKAIRLCFVGLGNLETINKSFVTKLGPVRNDRIWDYHYFADVGIAMAQGNVQHNECSKMYYYLRTGMPVVSEAPIPNNYLIKECGLGLICDYADDQMMADMIEAAVNRKWNKKDAIRYMVNNHTWDKRVGVYERLIKAECG